MRLYRLDFFGNVVKRGRPARTSNACCMTLQQSLAKILLCFSGIILQEAGTGKLLLLGSHDLTPTGWSRSSFWVAEASDPGFLFSDSTCSHHAGILQSAVIDPTNKLTCSAPRQEWTAAVFTVSVKKFCLLAVTSPFAGTLRLVSF